jgi:hypothetical protein
VFCDNIEMEALPATKNEIVRSQMIKAQLRPGDSRLRRDHRETTFSMFGTDRTIKSFELNIHPIADRRTGELQGMGLGILHD